VKPTKEQLKELGTKLNQELRKELQLRKAIHDYFPPGLLSEEDVNEIISSIKGKTK